MSLVTVGALTACVMAPPEQRLDPIEAVSVGLVLRTPPTDLEATQPLPADRDPALVYISALSTEKGRRTQRRAIAVIAEILGCPRTAIPWSALRYRHTNAIRAQLVARFAPATANRILSALRGILTEARRLGLISAEDAAAACDLRPAKGSRLPAGRALSASERRKLFRAAEHDPLAGRRDAALLALAYGCGLRRAEIVSLDLDSFSPADGTLRVLGKGSRERLAYVVAGRAHLDAWLEQRGAEPGPLFLPITRGGRLLRRRLTDEAVLVILKRLAARAGVEHFSPHDLRRSFVSDLLDAGADLSAAQQLAGHASPTTTQRYDRRGEQAKARAAKLIRF